MLEFADFTLDIERASLFRDGRKVDLRPKSFDLLRHLAKNPNRLISKDELVKVVWQGRIATDESLARCISDVRAALDDGEQRLIETVPRRGYIFKEQTRRAQRTRANPVDEPAVVSTPSSGEYALLPGRSGGGPDAFAWFRQQLNHRHRVGLLLCVGALIALSVWFTILRHQPGLELPARPSVVVLPFSNQTDERQWDYFATGFSEDIATGLSRYSQLFVISRESAAAYRASEPDTRLISSKLGVRYVLRGSLRRTSEHVRITAQLIDGVSGKYLWSEVFDKPVTDVFAIQDEIVGRLVATLVATVDRTAIERTRHKHPQSLGAYELYLQGRELGRTATRSNLILAEKLFENAIALDPDFAPAHAELAFVQYVFISTNVDPARRGEFLQKGLASARTALAISPSLPFANLALGDLLLRAHDVVEAEKWARRAVELGPGDADNYLGLANIGSPTFQVGSLRSSLPAIM